MQNKNRQIDKTHLSLDQAEARGIIHRDYIAHCFRWSHVVKHISKNAKASERIILDIGCGKEVPLIKSLYVNKMTPKMYFGVDVNRLSLPDMLKTRAEVITLFEKTDVCDLGPESVTVDGEKPSVITCFEVLEHVTPAHARRMVQKMRELISDDGHIFISTPCWNGKAANNHINEMTYEAVGTLLEDCGLSIVNQYGTFASQSDYKNHLGEWHYDLGDGDKGELDLRPLYKFLNTYYDGTALSTFFAPLFPERSRNVLWHCVKNTDEIKLPKRFNGFIDLQEPWGQHPNVHELAGGTWSLPKEKQETVEP